MDVAIEELVTQAGVSRARACALVGRSRASHYRAKNPPPPAPASVPRPQPRALREDERAAVLGALHSDRFIDSAPAEVYATLLDEGIYLASVSTMYRLLHSVGQVRERRAHSVHPASVKPELVAHGPNRVWSCYANLWIMPMLASGALRLGGSGREGRHNHGPVSGMCPD